MPDSGKENVLSIICVEKEKCVGCNACVRACPAGDANVARLDESGVLRIEIDDEKCIKCGACIKACSHGARYFQDDIDQFLADLKAGKEIAMIAAPAIKIAFDGNWRHALQWLRNNGVKAIYDVGFGARYLYMGACALCRKTSSCENHFSAVCGSRQLYSEA